MEEEHSLRLRAASTPRRARLEDAGPLTQLFTRAFLNDPVMDWLARSGPKRASGAEAFFFRILHWLTQLLARKPFRVVAVALANKMARIAWALLARGGTYRAPALAAAM